MIPWLALWVGAAPFGDTAETIIERAPERIRQHRMADLILRVEDADGRPAPGVEVRVEQVRHAFLFGCNIFRWGNLPPELEPIYRERFKEVFNYATLPFYWASYEPQQGQTREAQLRAVATWCRDNGITPKGHPVVWNHHAGAPRWLPAEPAEARRLSDERITAILSGFRGLIDIWDVVNEAVDPFRFENPLTQLFREPGTVPFVADCFKLARAAAPEATLVLNDYRLDQDFGRLAAQLVDDDGRPLYDVIGLQTHQHGRVLPPDRLQAVCDGFARLGVPLHFTETTIVSGPRTDAGWRTTPEGEAAQAAAVERYYTTLFAHPAVQAITWWDFSDNGAWQQAPAGFLRHDMSPKPAYEVLRRLIRQDWWTNETVRTGPDGTVTVRVFRGLQRVSAGERSQEVAVGPDGATVTLRR